MLLFPSYTTCRIRTIYGAGVRVYDVHVYIDAAWIATGVVWLAGAAGPKGTRRPKPCAPGWRTSRCRGCGVCCSLTPAWPSARWAWRFVPNAAFIAYSGLALTLAGIGLAIWARANLGQNWSAKITIKEGHRIIESGPYAVVRHPIYSGFLLAMLGTALVLGEVRALAAWALAFLGWKLKSRMEEEFMEHRFGAEYTS